ncbi:MAG: FAD-dependent oxidoreductase [Pseudomonadota bacterium]|nr:FAD-dependent oxidoreductase [Pseudomonadota bacterium]
MINDNDETCEVLVVGGGGAGLAAAIEARAQGASVILLEKNEKLGGTTAWSIGSFTATQTPHQFSSGIEDGPDEHFADMEKFAGEDAHRDNLALRRIFVDNASETLRWLMSFGLEFFGPMPEPPHTKSRMHNVLPNSRAYIRLLGGHAKKTGVDIRYNYRAERFLLDGDRVTGIEGTGPKGVIKIRARATVLASGDFAASEALKTKYISDAVARVDAMNPTATGDGHDMALPLGARVINGDILSGPNLRFIAPPNETIDRRLPPSRIVTRLMKLGLRFLPGCLLRPFVLRFTTTSIAPELDFFKDGALLINKRGERIDATAAELGLATAEQPDQIGYVILDSQLAKRYSAWPHFIATAPGVAYAYFDDFRRTRPDIFYEAETMEKLAEALHMPLETINGSIISHNSSDTPHKLIHPPYYSLGPAKAYIVLTDGGLAVDEKLQPLGNGNKPIEGLWAAGSVGQGGLLLKGHGHHIGWAFTSGRLAGRNAALSTTDRG